MKKTYKHDTKNRTPFQQRLVDLRVSRDLTGQQLADILNVSRDCVVQWENKPDRQPALDKIILLADLYNVSIDYLLGRVDFVHVGNKEINKITGLSDKAIEKLRKIKQSDQFITESNKKNKKKNLESDTVKPVILPLKMPLINFVIESRRFNNLVSDFAYYLNSHKFKHFLNDHFKKLPTDALYPADQNYIASSSGIEINGDTNKALAKNLLDIHLESFYHDFNTDDAASKTRIKTTK